MNSIKHYRKEVSYIKPGTLKVNEIHIKQDEITYNDLANKLVYKRVFRNDLQEVKAQTLNLPVAIILEQINSPKETEFLLEFIEGYDVFIYMKNHPEHAEDTIIRFEEFLSQWLGYDDNSQYLSSFSFDINPGNFIINPNTKKITKIDYLSDWGKREKALCYYLLPFINLINRKVLSEVTVSQLINKRFQNHHSKTSYQKLFEELKNYPDDSSSSDD